MGSKFNDCLAEEGILEKVESSAIERVLIVELGRRFTQISITDSGCFLGSLEKDIKTRSSKQV